MQIGRSGSEWSDLKVVVCVNEDFNRSWRDVGVVLYILIDLGSYAYTAVLYGRDTSVHFL